MWILLGTNQINHFMFDPPGLYYLDVWWRRENIMVKFLIVIIFYTVTVFDIILVTVSQCYSVTVSQMSLLKQHIHFFWVNHYLLEGQNCISYLWSELFIILVFDCNSKTIRFYIVEQNLQIYCVIFCFICL